MVLLRALTPSPFLPLPAACRKAHPLPGPHRKRPAWVSPAHPFPIPAYSLSPHKDPHGAVRPPLLASRTGKDANQPDAGNDAKPRTRRRRRQNPEADAPVEDAGGGGGKVFPSTIPRKPRRGRRSEAAVVEDFVRGSLERTFAEIRRQNPEVLEGKEGFFKGREEEEEGGGEGEGVRRGGAEREEVVDEDDPDWPADAEVGWGTRASEYFDKHPIRNVVVDGVEIDWEGEVDEGWVKEINCLEWESFAFHPSPLIVLVFERYNRAADNWKLLKELEKAAKVYWSAKDRLPPRTVKIDMNIEKDLAYALKVKECPQLLFLRGNKILYREKDMRTADELVQMIAHFYYNARRPSWVDAAAVAPPY